MTNLLELGTESNQDLYGLLDTENNFLYQVHYKKSIIQHLSDLTVQTRPVAVVPLHVCGNWRRNLIDNTNCTGWAINCFWHTLQEQALQQSNIYLVEHNDPVDTNLKLLADNLNFVIEFVFHVALLDSTHFHTSIPPMVEILFADDPWLQTAIDYEKNYNTQYQLLYQQHWSTLLEFTREFDITHMDYVTGLQHKIKQYCLQVDAEFFWQEKIYV